MHVQEEDEFDDQLPLSAYKKYALLVLFSLLRTSKFSTEGHIAWDV